MPEAKSFSASLWVERFAAGVPPGGQVLDVACGRGRHFELFLARGCRVVGIDRDVTEAQRQWGKNPSVDLLSADLEDGTPPVFRGKRFGAVVATNYLWRPLLPDIVAAVAADGLLIYETFMRGNERLGRPSNPNFLLQPQELLKVVEGGLATVAFEQAQLSGPDRLVQRIVAVGWDHPWAAGGAPPA